MGGDGALDVNWEFLGEYDLKQQFLSCKGFYGKFIRWNALYSKLFIMKKL